jgi:hypothetical protein
MPVANAPTPPVLLKILYYRFLVLRNYLLAVLRGSIGTADVVDFS